MRNIRTDVLVVGSGFGAAPAALRFAEAGLRVTVVEKGPRIDPGSATNGFKQTQDPRYLLKFFKGTGGENLSTTQIEALGGGSGFYEMVSLRAPSIAFEQRDDRGRRVWPRGISRAAMDRFYDLGESILKVEQIPEHLVPKTGLVFSRLMKNLGYSCDRAPYAVRNCLGSGFCVTGCIYGAKQSLLLNYLPGAGEHGADIATDTEAVEIRQVDHDEDDSLPYRYAVLCHGPDGPRTTYTTRILVLAGGTIGTAKLLLRSRATLPRLSSQTGRNIGFNGGVKTAAILGPELPDGDMFSGRSHPGMISYEFLESRGITIAAGKPLPLQLVAAARLRLPTETGLSTYWGADNVDLVSQYRHRMLVIAAFGLTAPTGVLHHRGGDDFHLELQVTDRLREYYRETRDLLHSIFTRNGCTPIRAEFIDGEGMPRDGIHFSTTHQVGAARMADSPATGTCDRSGQVFGYPGMYVTDGAAIPSSLAVNTSLTILANSERIVAGVLNGMGRSASRTI